MPRLLLLLVLAMTIAACATTQASNKPASAPSQAAADYYPLIRGWGWAYDLERDGQTVLAVYSVTGAEGQTATVLNAGETIRYAVLPEGIARHDGLQGDFLLKNPVIEGARWPVFAGEAHITKVGAIVTVGSEVYTNCLVVEETRQDPLRITRTTYAQGVGPIDIEMQVQDGSTKSFVTTVHARIRGVTKPETGATEK